MTTEFDPKTVAEYNEKAARGTRYSGFGVDTMAHAPCPACAEPDFMSWKILEVKEATARGAVCAKCGRGFKGLIDESHGGTSIEFVQTQGDDLPEYLPKMRRV